MSYSQQRKDIQKFLNDNLDISLVPANKRAWDNVNFTIPKNAPWIRTSVSNNISNFKSLGPNRLTRREGFIFIQVFVPQDTETNEALTIVDSVVNIFETKLLSGLVFRSPSVNEVGTSNGWFQINISVPFWYDQITTTN